MKYVRLTARLGVLSLLLLLLAGCSNEEALDMKDKAQGITLALTIPASETIFTKAATTDPLPGESFLSNVYVLFYPKNVDVTATPSYFYAETNINKDEKWTYKIPVADLKASLAAGTKYDVYIVASLPTATTAPTDATTKGTLLALSETQFVRSAAPLMSFSGQGEVTYIPDAGITVDIQLRRTVARLDITLQGLKTGQTAELQLIQAPTTPYYKDDSFAASEFSKDVLTSTTDFYRAYVYENYPSDATQQTQLLLTVKNDNGSTSAAYQPIVINKGAIDRNKIYDIQLTILADRLVVVTGDAIEWAGVVGGGTLSPLPTLPKANSYIVTPGGDAVFIPVSQVIAAKAFDNTIPLIGDTEHLTAELVWTDTKGATLGLSDDASLAEIAVIGVGPYARLMVKPGSKPGNSVVAIKGEDGKIKWSWHIWATNYNPEVPEGQHDVTGDIFMDRNLGAMAYHAITPDLAGNLQAIGMFYEWGRKDPFPKPNIWEGKVTELKHRVAYRANGGGVSITHVYGGTSSAYTYAYTVENPYTFIAANGNWNWIIAAHWTGKEWGQSADATVDPKTPYDPCPPGWRVATRLAYAKLVGPTFTFTGYRGAVSAAAIGNKVMYFPSNGYIYYNSNSQDETLTSLFSARSTASNNGTGFLINTTNKGSIVSSTSNMFAPASACNIRCIKE